MVLILAETQELYHKRIGEFSMLTKLLKKDFDQVYDLMEQSFPDDEYRPYEEQKALLDQPAYQIYVEKDCETQMIRAFLAVWEFDNFAHLEHFAVNPQFRGNGLGSKALGELLSLLGKTVCLEVELPNTEIASRRINFYRRNNMFLNTYPYMQPPISKGKKPIPLMIMTSNKEVDRESFDKIKKVLYEKVYRYYGNKSELY